MNKASSLNTSYINTPRNKLLAYTICLSDYTYLTWQVIYILNLFTYEYIRHLMRHYIIRGVTHLFMHQKIGLQFT